MKRRKYEFKLKQDDMFFCPCQPTAASYLSLTKLNKAMGNQTSSS